MWTLPLERQITIRKVEKPLRDLLGRASAIPVGNAANAWHSHHQDRFVKCETTGEVRAPWKWDGERIGVVLGREVCVERGTSGYSGGDVLYNLIDGSWSEAKKTQIRHDTPDFRSKFENYIMGTLAPGELYANRSNVPVLFLHQLWDTDEKRGVLEVARDAILQAAPDAEGRWPMLPKEISAMMRHTLPYAHGLFLALVRKERDILHGGAL